MKKRIDYFDGLKFVLCYMVMLMHYALAFLPAGYAGFGSGVAPEDQISTILEYFPFSLLINSSLVLYIFFALISVIVTIVFYTTRDQQKFLEKQCVKRYFRFMTPVAAIILLTYGLDRGGLLHFEDAYALSGSSWNLAIAPWAKSWWEALYIAFLKSYFMPDNAILTVLWCLDIIFIGSFLTYGFLACMGNSKRRFGAYIALAVLGCVFPKYLIYLVGIVCGDVFVHGLPNTKLQGWKKEAAAWLLLVSGIIIGYIPGCFLPEGLSVILLYCIGTMLFLLGLMYSEFLQRILSAKFLVSQAKYSFCLLLTQIPVMFGISYHSFKWISQMTGNYLLTFAINAVIYAVVTHLISIAFYHVFEKPSIKLADWIYCLREKK